MEAVPDIEEAGAGEEERGVRVVPARVLRRSTSPTADEELARATASLEAVPGTQTVWIHTAGCAHNTSDSEFLAGQLQAFGYALASDAQRDNAALWLLVSCTVKNPSQSALETLINRGRAAGKALLVAGCVPQGDRDAPSLAGLSLLGTHALERVVEAVQETLKGNTVRFLSRGPLPSLDLPKVRRNRFVEIIPLSTGCLGACLYCKTVHARGKLGSYAPAALLARAADAVREGSTEVWLSSEDTGAYGRDIGTSLAELLSSLLGSLAPDGSVMVRVGMTNPPFVLNQLDAIADALNHPCCFASIHVPVQSGSDAVLSASA